MNLPGSNYSTHGSCNPGSVLTAGRRGGFRGTAIVPSSLSARLCGGKEMDEVNRGLTPHGSPSRRSIRQRVKPAANWNEVRRDSRHVTAWIVQARGPRSPGTALASRRWRGIGVRRPQQISNRLRPRRTPAWDTRKGPILAAGRLGEPAAALRWGAVRAGKAKKDK